MIEDGERQDVISDAVLLDLELSHPVASQISLPSLQVVSSKSEYLTWLSNGMLGRQIRGDIVRCRSCQQDCVSISIEHIGDILVEPALDQGKAELFCQKGTTAGDIRNTHCVGWKFCHEVLFLSFLSNRDKLILCPPLS